MKPSFENLFGIDLRSLALFRILLGSILLVYLGVLALDLINFYTDAGFLPRSLALQFYPSPWRLSAHMMSGNILFITALFLVQGILAVLLMLGWRTRWVTCLTWFLLMSLHARNPMVLHSGDYLLRLLFFWSMFLPLGAFFSLDRKSNSSLAPVPTRIFSVGSVCFLLEVAFVYFFTAIAKWNDPGWQEGRSVLQSLQTVRYTTPLGAWLLEQGTFHKILSYAVLWFETLGPILLFSPVATALCRSAAVVGFFLLQLGFGFFLNLGNFPWVSAVGFIPFIPSAVWDKVFVKFPFALPKFGIKVKNFRPLSLKTPAWANALAILSLLCVAALNVSNVSRKFSLPEPLDNFKILFFLDQRWNMFAPLDEANIWIVVTGEQRDGIRRDLLKNQRDIRWEKPPYGHFLYRNEHWNKYMNHLWADRFRAARGHYAWSWCRNWNARHAGGERLKRVELYALNERFYPEPKPVKKFHLWTHYCFKEDIPREIPSP